MLLRDLNLKSGESEDEKEIGEAREEEKKMPSSSLLIQEEDKQNQQHFRTHKV